MAGGITDTGELYSPSVGLVYMFNLIVGTGALTMPKAFATAGWVVSLVLISVLAFMSYITTTFVIEAMAAANAQLRWKRRENQKFAVCDRLRDELYAFTTMIILALIRIGKGKGEGHPPAAVLLGVPNLFGVCVYSFMCQHSLPSVVTPISDKRRVSALVLLDYVLILSFYSLLSFTAIFCFDSGVLKDMYTLNFTDSCDVIGVAFLRYFLGLFPVFTISTNFPIIAVTLRNNWKTLFHRGGTYPWVVDRVVFPLITLVPPIIVAFCTHDLETLVGITGAFAGTGIQYIIPACLVYFGRKDVGLTYGDAADNKHRSPFHHVFWVWFVLVWAGSCLMFVTANIVLTETKH
ncbi:TM104 protein, partial [Polypterus senegalus]